MSDMFKNLSPQERSLLQKTLKEHRKEIEREKLYEIKKDAREALADLNKKTLRIIPEHLDVGLILYYERLLKLLNKAYMDSERDLYEYFSFAEDKVLEISASYKPTKPVCRMPPKLAQLLNQSSESRFPARISLMEKFLLMANSLLLGESERAFFLLDNRIEAKVIEKIRKEINVKLKKVKRDALYR